MSLLPDARVHAKALQSGLTLFNFMGCSPADSSVHGILWSITLEWVCHSFSRGSSWCRDWTPISCVSCIASGFFTAEPPGKPSVAQSRLSSVLNLGKCRLCRPVRCSPTGGHKETGFQSPSGRGEKLDSLGWWWQLPRGELMGQGSPWDLPGWNRRIWKEPAWACGSPPGGP